MTDLLDLIKGTPSHRLMAKKATIVFDQSQRFVVKGGEGSRGGNVIGHTSSGKPIYARPDHSSHEQFTHKDHGDAEDLHEKLSEAAFDRMDDTTSRRSGGAGMDTRRAHEKEGEEQYAHSLHHMEKRNEKAPKPEIHKLGDLTIGHKLGSTYQVASVSWDNKQVVLKPQAGTRLAASGRKVKFTWDGTGYKRQGEYLATGDKVTTRKSVDDTPDLVKGGGPFIGKRGGKWADSDHTIAWKEGKTASRQRKHAHAGTTKGWLNDHKDTTADEHRELRAKHNRLSSAAASKKRSVRPQSNAAHAHQYEQNYHDSMGNAHAYMAIGKDAHGGMDKYDVHTASAQLDNARGAQQNHEDATIGGEALQPSKDAKGNLHTMGTTASGKTMAFLSGPNFRDHTHGWRPEDHHEAAGEHSARSEHQYARSDAAQREGDWETGARHNAAGRYHQDMATVHRLRGDNPKSDKITPRAELSSAAAAQGLSNPGRLSDLASGGDKPAHVNAKYLDSLPPAKKAKILNHVANHYGVSVAEIEDEVNDSDAENLFEYTATDARMSRDIYNDFKRQGLMASKSVDDNPDLLKAIELYDRIAGSI